MPQANERLKHKINFALYSFRWKNKNCSNINDSLSLQEVLAFNYLKISHFFQLLGISDYQKIDDWDSPRQNKAIICGCLFFLLNLISPVLMGYRAVDYNKSPGGEGEIILWIPECDHEESTWEKILQPCYSSGNEDQDRTPGFLETG